MHVVLLGTAAGGGFPQWNCWCTCCRTARAEPDHAVPRTQSSVAISAHGRRWFLLNASPDVREQLRHLGDSSGTDIRRSPVAGIVLTDAELDHTLGLPLLRESGGLTLYATRTVLSTLEHDSRLLPVTRAFAEVSTIELPVGRPVELRAPDGEPSGLMVEAFTVPGGPPRFARDAAPGHTVGLLITDETTDGKLGYLPGCGELNHELLAKLADVDLLLFDGTFWSDDELVRLGINGRRARDMDHLPIWGPGGSLEYLARLGAGRNLRTVYVHLNNTNPVLLEHSAEREAVTRSGATIGRDGMAFTL